MTTRCSELQKFVFSSDHQDSLLELVILTDRMRLIPIEERFAEDIFKEFTAEITRYMFPTEARSIEEPIEFIRGARANMMASNELVLVALDKKTSEFLGMVGLHGRASAVQPDLGLWFKKASHGRGFGKEVIYALIIWARDNLELESFRYPVDRNNIPSRKIPESLNAQIVHELIAPTMDPERFLDEVIFDIPVKSDAVQRL